MEQFLNILDFEEVQNLEHAHDCWVAEDDGVLYARNRGNVKHETVAYIRPLN